MPSSDQHPTRHRPTTPHGPAARQRPTTLVALAGTTGALMAAYLLLRPYGDSVDGESAAAAEAFASSLWIWSHLAGAAALVALAALWALLSTGPTRWAAVAGAALVLPYYGAETFALHAIGMRARTQPDVLPLVPAVRDNPVAMTLFGIGLIALAGAGIAAAVRWRREHHRGSRHGRIAGAWLPLAVVAALFLPQFFMPPAGRIAYGLLFAAAAAYAVYALIVSAQKNTRPDLADPPADPTSDRAPATATLPAG